MKKSDRKNSLIWKPFHGPEYRIDLRKCKLLSVISDFFRDIRRCHQRIWKGYCDHDLFSIDSWFLGVIPNMLEEFLNTTHSYPIKNKSDIHTIASGTVTGDDAYDQAEDKELALWKNEISKIIHLLRESSEESCSRQNPYEDEYLENRLKHRKTWKDEKGFLHTCFETPDDESSLDLEARYLSEEKKLAEYREKSREDAFALLSEWLPDLWD